MTKLTIIYSPVAAFVEVATRARMERQTRPMERRLARQVARWFVKQGKAIVVALRPLRGRFDMNAVRENLSAGDWAALVGQVLMVGSPELEEILEKAQVTALSAGAKVALDGLGDIGIVFQMDNPLAAAYAEGRAAAQVTRINETTRKQLNSLLTDAIAQNLGWTTVAGMIEEMFEDFAGPPLFPSKKFTSRAQMIAAFEIGDAYEAGGFLSMQAATAAGIEIEKRWLNAGDGRVRSAHVANSAEGYIDLEKSFSSGHMRPPTDGGCRCTLVYRRKRRAGVA